MHKVEGIIRVCAGRIERLMLSLEWDYYLLFSRYSIKKAAEKTCAIRDSLYWANFDILMQIISRHVNNVK